MIARVLGLVCVYTGCQLVLRATGLFPEGWTPEWWAYSIGIGLVISPLYVAYSELKRVGERNGK